MRRLGDMLPGWASRSRPDRTGRGGPGRGGRHAPRRLVSRQAGVQYSKSRGEGWFASGRSMPGVMRIGTAKARRFVGVKRAKGVREGGGLQTALHGRDTVRPVVNLERAMGIEPTSLAWEARVIAIIRRPRRPRFYRVFWGLGSGVSRPLVSKLAWLGGGAVASTGGVRDRPVSATRERYL